MNVASPTVPTAPTTPGCGAAPAGTGTSPDQAFADVLAGLAAPAVATVPAQPTSHEATPVTDDAPAPEELAADALVAGAVPLGLPLLATPLPAPPAPTDPAATAPADGVTDAVAVVPTGGSAPAVAAPATTPTPEPPPAPVAQAQGPQAQKTDAPTVAVRPTGADSGTADLEPVRRPEPQPTDVPRSEAPQAVPAAPQAAPVSPQAPVAAATHVEKPTQVRHVPEVVVEAAKRMRADGTGRSSLVVRLDPPELGAVVVRLTVQDGRVDVSLRAPDAGLTGTLRSQSADVQDVLRSHGLDLGAFDVSAQGGRSHMAQEGSPDRGTPQRFRADDDSRNDRNTTHVTDDVTTQPSRSGTWL